MRLTFWSARLKTALDDWRSNLLGEALAEALEEDLLEDGTLSGAWKKLRQDWVTD